MSMALQQEVASQRAEIAALRTQVTKLSAQLVVESSKRSDLTTRLAQLEDAFSGFTSSRTQPKEQQHGNSRSAKVRA